MMVYTNFNASFLLHKISTLNCHHRAGLPNWKILDQTKELTVGKFNDHSSKILSVESNRYILSLVDGLQIIVDSFNIDKVQAHMKMIQAHNQSQSRTGKIIYIKYLVRVHFLIGFSDKKLLSFFKKVIQANDYHKLSVIITDYEYKNPHNSRQQYIIKRNDSS